MAQNREPLRLLPIVIGVGVTALMAAALVFHDYYRRFGLDGATSVDLLRECGDAGGTSWSDRHERCVNRA